MKDIVKGFKIGTGISIPLIIMVLAINVFAITYPSTIKQTQHNITIPTLTKDSAYTLELYQNKYIPCPELEKKLGLPKGSIISITNNDEIGTTIKFAKNVLIDTAKITSIEQIYNKGVTNITVK